MARGDDDLRQWAQAKLDELQQTIDFARSAQSELAEIAAGKLRVTPVDQVRVDIVFERMRDFADTVDARLFGALMRTAGR